MIINIERPPKQPIPIHPDFRATTQGEGDQLTSETDTKNSFLLSQTSEWEGYVEKIEGDRFYAKLVNIASNSGFPEQEGWFSIKDLKESRRHELEEGSIIRLITGVRQTSDGQHQEFHEVQIAETSMHTKEEISASIKKAKKLLDHLNIKDDALPTA